MVEGQEEVRQGKMEKGNEHGSLSNGGTNTPEAFAAVTDRSRQTRHEAMSCANAAMSYMLFFD
jgi:hypothetical protein